MQSDEGKRAMKPKSLLTGGVIGLLALAPQAVPQATPQVEQRSHTVSVFGAGQWSCGQWTALVPEIQGATNRVLDAEDSAALMRWRRAEQLDSWLMGFISGASSQAGQRTGAGDNAALTAWVSNYCRDHPLDAVASAASQLSVVLLKQP
jgi:hypothetical protein